MGSRRIALAGLGIVVVGGLVALVVFARGGGSDSAANPSRGGADGSTAEAPTPPRPPDRKAADPAPPDRANEVEEVDDGPEEYVRDDGVVVRDHRSGDHEPMLSGPIKKPGTPGKIDRMLIYTVRKTLRPLVYACADEAEPEITGEHPELQTQIMVSIAGGSLTVDRADVKPHDLEGPELVECVKSAIEEVGLSAEGHPDVSLYWLTMPFRMQR